MGNDFLNNNSKVINQPTRAHNNYLYTSTPFQKIKEFQTKNNSHVFNINNNKIGKKTLDNKDANVKFDKINNNNENKIAGMINGTTGNIITPQIQNAQINNSIITTSKAINNYDYYNQNASNLINQNRYNTTIMTMNNDIIQNNNQLKKEKQYYISQINELKKQNDILTNNYNIYKGEIVNLKNNTNVLGKQLLEYKNQMNEFTHNINSKNNEIITLNNQIRLLQNTIAQKEKIIEDDKRKIYELLEEKKRLSINLNDKRHSIKLYSIGLDNIGATCYMNAALQCLSNTPELKKYFLEKYNKEFNTNDPSKTMSTQFYNVVYNIWINPNNKKSYSPQSFKEAISRENPLFEGIAANDSKDLINFLLERFHNELNKGKIKPYKNNIVVTQKDQLDEKSMLNLFLNDFKKYYNSIISNLFYGVLETKSLCQGCGNTKFNFQIYSFIEFPLKQVNEYCFRKGKQMISSNNYKNPDVDLIDCFEYYCYPEFMTGDNQMYCAICQNNFNSFYGSQIYSLPNYLIIILNRGKGAVYECKVNFPEKLNLLNFVNFKDGNSFLRLYAVISHLGPSSMSGHFIAYIKNMNDKKWYKYNDSIVTPCTKNEEFREGMPYILFYNTI